MMEALKFTQLIKEHGISGLLIIALFWMNARLNSVEQRLYECMNARANYHGINHTLKDHQRLVAVLPKELKIVKNEP